MRYISRMHAFIDQLTYTVNQLLANLPLALMIIAALWLIQLLNWATHYRLNYLGIYPRHVFGLIGIPCSPFIHNSFNHLLFNSIALLAFMILMLLNGVTIFITASILIIFIGGFLIWLFARTGLHVGASALIMGYFGFLIVNAYFAGSVLAILIALVCLYYFGSLFINLFPSNKKVSWEGHVFGFAAGLLTSYITPVVLKSL